MLVQHRLALYAILLGLLNASLQVVELSLLATMRSSLLNVTLFFGLLKCQFLSDAENSFTVSELCRLPVGTRSQSVM